MVAVDPDVPAHIAQFVDRFYKITDADDHDLYLAQFEPDATFNVLAPRQGRDAIMAGRRWSFANRGSDQVHRWFHIWCPEGDNVAFVHGDNDFTRKKDGLFVNVPFIARMTFNGKPDDLRIKDYYVWVVSCTEASLTEALPRGRGLLGPAGGRGQGQVNYVSVGDAMHSDAQVAH